MYLYIYVMDFSDIKEELAFSYPELIAGMWLWTTEKCLSLSFWFLILLVTYQNSDGLFLLFGGAVWDSIVLYVRLTLNSKHSSCFSLQNAEIVGVGLYAW